MIDVAAAVIQRADRRVLLAQRPPGKVYAGYWEFPGGKIEPGEPPERALARELREELGIDTERCYPWLTREYVYPHGRVRLNFFRVLAWRGEPQPREDQAIAWQALESLSVSPMLPANAPVLASLTLPHEYAITDAGRLGTAPMLAALERRLEQDLRLVQVREPALAPAERERFAAQVVGLAHRYGAKVLTKEPAPGADGVHYTAAELMRLGRRPQRGLAAASCHTRVELERAMALELDFAVLGPVLEKHGAAPLGWERFAEIARAASIPVYAIGGLTPADRERAWQRGAHGLAMIRGSWR
ncbi:MAG TPA: Nudix family hydrolase [Burkholderiales bacterium]|nr:Nudix family hydrolase [Burkholderiales bacterium]